MIQFPAALTEMYSDCEIICKPPQHDFLYLLDIYFFPSLNFIQSEWIFSLKMIIGLES